MLFSKARATAKLLRRNLSAISTGKINQPVKQTYFYKDKRIGERRSYGKPLELKDGRTIHFEIADEKDEDLLLNQYLDGFVNQISYFRAFDITHDDYRDLFREHVKMLLPVGGTMFGFHEDNLVCFRLVTYHNHDDIPEVFGPLANPGDPPPVVEFPKDIGPLVNAGRTFRSVIVPNEARTYYPRLSMVVLELVEKQIGKFLPADVKNLAYAEGLFVHDEFQRNGISEYLSDVSDDLAIEHGCNYVANITVATASTEMSKKRNFKTLFHIPYDQLYVNGELEFKDLWDKNKGWSANLRKLY
uniref:N-acetyltransferase domain-containing protein n=1 Tax=Panagrellus redivivus TaxID=6233 RepID=A0A7E4V5E4_PANRE